MTVAELKEYLEDLDDNAEVYLLTQPDYPFEHSIRSVCQRGDISDEGANEDGDEDDNGEYGNESDVFLVEGRQIRYGQKDYFNL